MTKSTNPNGHTDGEASAYSPPTAEDRNGNIVDMVCRIVDDDGPRPMRYLRPTQKNRNAAEQFDFEHQEAYEARGKQSRNRMEVVGQHNSGYPKLRDELDRKRSVAEVTMSNTHRNVSQHTVYNHCNACIKNKKRSTPKKKSRTSRYPRDSKKKAGPRQSSITKPKSRLKSKQSRCIIGKISRIQMNRSCQCSSYFLASHKMSGTNETPLNMECQNQNQLAEESTFLMRDVKNISECKKSSNGSQHSRDGFPKTIPEPDTDGSITSYESFASLGHEPMV